MSNLDQRVINTIRVLSAEIVEKANSGHPGLPLGAAPLTYTLWFRHLKHSPSNPKWVNRDRFILSAGHGSALIYSLLYLFRYGLVKDDLMNFRQWNSKTPGHPEFKHTIGIETTTGPLGQGIANGVGMAIAEAHLASKFNQPGWDIINHYTYVLVSDGCMMEGVSSEAASLAGTLGLEKLIVIYDSNKITIEGSTSIAFRENVGKRFEAYGWHVLKVPDGNDTDAIDQAITEARMEREKPSLIEVSTVIGYGCPSKQGKASAHGEPLGEDNLKILKENMQLGSEPPFSVSSDILEYMNQTIQKLTRDEAEWNKMWEAYSNTFPGLADEWDKWHNKEIPTDLLKDQSFWTFDEKPTATRASSSEVLNRLANLLPNLIGGSADLAPSTKALLKGRADFSPEDYSGQNMHFGVREHAMGSIANGIAVHGGLITYVATFFIFSDYMKPAMRLSAIMGIPVIYVFTHDSIGLGEDGPTHQPVEQLAALRSIPGFIDFRPADSKETAAAWYFAVTRKTNPIALILSRQNLPQLKETGNGALRGAYILLDSEKHSPDIIIIATGSEVRLAYEAHTILKEKGIDARVVSMPSVKLFEEQSSEYRENILPSSVRNRLVVEAASSYGWHKYTGFKGEIISMDTFGASAPSDILFKEFGFTLENVVNKATALVEK